jgi:hypothetical protein
MLLRNSCHIVFRREVVKESQLLIISWKKCRYNENRTIKNHSDLNRVYIHELKAFYASLLNRYHSKIKRECNLCLSFDK